jgi:hypothetical protein
MHQDPEKRPDCRAAARPAGSDMRAAGARSGVTPPAAVLAVAAVCMALAVQAPVAGASTTFTTPTPDVGILPFPSDVYTRIYQGAPVPIDPTSTPASVPQFLGSPGPGEAQSRPGAHPAGAGQVTG